MSWSVLLLAAAGAVAVLLLFVKLRGDGRGNLTGPPKRKPRRLSRQELDRMTELVGQNRDGQNRDSIHFSPG